MKTMTSLEIKWGIIFTLFSLLWMVFEKTMGWHDENIARHAVLTNLFAIPAIVIYVYAMLEKRKKQLNNIMTWKQGFLCGLMVTLVVAILAPLAQFITFQLITPDYFKNAIEYSVNIEGKDREEMESFFSLKNYIIQSVFGALVIGVVTSAIVALFVKRTPLSETNQQRMQNPKQ